jgi:ribosomal protein S18 acetylase RimI-like enzyme
VLAGREPPFAHVPSGVTPERPRRLRLQPGDTVVVDRAVSRNTDPSPTAANDLVSVRILSAPTRRETAALAEIFDQYRAHYGEEADTSRSARWLDENLSTSRLRVFVAEDNEKFVGFAITIEVPASLRLAHFWQIRDLFVLPTHRRLGVGRAVLASVRAAAIASGALRLVLQTEDDNDPALRLYADSDYTLIKGYCSLMLPLGPEPQ